MLRMKNVNVMSSEPECVQCTKVESKFSHIFSHIKFAIIYLKMLSFV